MIDRDTVIELALQSGAAKFYPERQAEPVFIDAEKLIAQSYLVGAGFLERFAQAIAQKAVEGERERICAAIKAEDDYCVDEGDYMLDSNDCIKVARGQWVRPDYSIHKRGIGGGE